VFEAKNHVTLQNLHATGQAIFLRVLVPLIEDIEFLIRGRFKILHAGIDGNSAGAARAIEATRLHFDARLFARIEYEGTGGNFGGLASR
jgi:hypothetical protein